MERLEGEWENMLREKRHRHIRQESAELLRCGRKPQWVASLSCCRGHSVLSIWVGGIPQCHMYLFRNSVYRSIPYPKLDSLEEVRVRESKQVHLNLFCERPCLSINFQEQPLSAMQGT